MPETSFRLAPYAQLRFNWVPAAPPDTGPRDDLRLLAERAVELLDLVDTTADAAAAALERLTPVVDQAARGAVLRLRRDVFNRRPPRAPLPAAAAAEPVVAAWADARWEYDAVAAKLRDALDAATEAERRDVRAACARPELLRALALSSRSLVADARRYAAADVTALPSRLAKSEDAIVRYLDRARLRTSPFGWYTSTALLPFDEERTAPLPSLDDLRGAVSRVEAGHALLRRLADAVVRHPDVRRVLTYALADDLRADGETVRFRVLADEGHPRVYGNVEREEALRRTVALDALAGWLREQGGPVSWDALLGLAASWGSRITAEAAERYLHGLADAGLLRPVLPLREQDPDLLGSLRDFLAALPAEPAQSVARALGDVAAALAAVGTDDVDARLAALAAVEESFAAAFVAAGSTPPRLPATLYENTLVPVPVPVGAAPWRDLAPDAAAVATVLEAFDRSFVLRALIREELVAAYGPGGECDLAGFRDVVGRAMERWGLAIVRGLPAETAGGPLAAAAAVRAELVGEYLRASRAGEAELDLTGRVAAIAERLAPPRRAWTSYSLFLQPEVGPDGRVTRAVLNHFYNGLSAYTSRFLAWTDDTVVDTVRRRVRDVFPAGDAVAEIRPVRGFNANLHPLLTDAELDLDGQTPDGWPLSRLVARHDEATDEVRLTDRETGRTVHVLYLGFLIPFLLPSTWAALYTLASRGPVLDPFGAPAEAGRPLAERRAVRSYPRVTVGRIVLERRRWHVPLAELRVAVGDTRDEQALVRLLRFARAHGMPDELFYRARPVQDIDTGEPVAEQIARNAPWAKEKPRYLCLTSSLRVRSFVAWLARADQDLVFEEALPSPGAACIAGPVGRHVAEVVLEVDR
ncbi:MAG TPA: lantibiotic dehydratase [Frankiaceae bacterium]|nr:lantibiotic dehydratase [Frankiaceae bacterium]